MRVLGVDPGIVVLGYGIVEAKRGGPHSIKYGHLRLSSKEPFPVRLKKIYDEVSSVIVAYKPDQVAIESLYYAENAKVAIKMGHARGVAILAAAHHEIPTSEYSPREIKQSVVGNGAASKQQVQRMMQHLLHLDKLPEPLDASDALAVALCHLHRMESKL